MTTNPTDRSFKKLLDKRVTSDGKAVYEEVGDEALTITSDQIWSMQIANNDPATSISEGTVAFEEKIVFTEDTTVANQQSWYLEKNGSRAKDWVSDRFGSDFTAKLYDNNGAQIFPTDVVDWLFDYKTGILTFENTPSAFTQPFKLDGYQYSGVKGLNANGSYRVVANAAARDAILVSERVIGMVIRYPDGTRYSLGAGLTNSDWNRLTFDGYGEATTEPILYVDIVAGDDDNDGTISSPLLTVQEAVYRFIPPGLPAPEWVAGNNKTVEVVWSNGMPDMTDSLHIPYHRGDGALRIVAQEEVVHSGLVQDGALISGGVIAPDGYYQVRQGMNVTTSPMTPNALNDTHFVRPALNLAKEILEAGLENAVISSNNAGALDIELYKPGLNSGYGYADGMVFDVVKPQITWKHKPKAVGFAFVSNPLIKIDGGVVEFSGFNFPTYEWYRQLFQFDFAGVDIYNSMGNLVTRCIFDADYAPVLFSGRGLFLTSCIFNHGDGAFNLVNALEASTIVNVRVVDQNALSTWSMSKVENVTIFGISISEGFLLMRNCSGVEISGFDLRSAKMEIFKSDLTSFTNFSIVDSVTDGVEVEMTNIGYFGGAGSVIINSAGSGLELFSSSAINSFVAGSEFSGNGNSGVLVHGDSHINTMGATTGLGNSSYGLYISENSTVNGDGTSSLTGTLGDVKVGSEAVQVWGDGTVTNNEQLCRFVETGVANSPSNDLYVDTVAGNDSNSGSASSPLLTIQHAVDRFIPPGESTAEWDRDVTKTVHVVWTNGMSDITEFVHVPYHKGEGTLSIIAEEEVVHSGLVQSGALVGGGVIAPDGYAQTRQGLNVTTSPMTPGALAGSHFVRPTVNPNENQIEFAYEFAAIMDNDAGSLDINMVGPGSLSGFGYANAMVFDVVKPQIKWHHPANQAFITFSSAPLIKIDGGMVEVSGFDMTNSGDSRTIFRLDAPESTGYNNLTNAITRCLFEDTRSGGNEARWFTGSGYWVSGCIYKYSGLKTFMEGTNDSYIHNLLIVDTVGTGGTLRIGNCRGISFGGLYFEDGLFSCRDNIIKIDGCDFRNHKAEFVGCIISSFIRFSFVGAQTDGAEFENCTISNFGGVGSYLHDAAGHGVEFISTRCYNLESGTSLSNNGSNGVLVSNGSSVQNSNGALTGTGNGTYGVQTTENSFFVGYNTSTLTGTSGDVKVGDAAVQSWGAGNTTDLVELCRFLEA